MTAVLRLPANTVAQKKTPNARNGLLILNCALIWCPYN